MKRALVCCMLIVASFVQAEDQASLKKILDATTDMPFGSFCEFISVPKDQIREFASYYETQTKKIKRVKSSATRQARAQELRDKGRSALEVEEPGVYSEFIALETSAISCESPRACVAENARLFLSRYGAWHEFKKSHVQTQASMWHKVKDFAKDSSQRVAQWFGPRQEMTVAAN